MGTSEVQPLRVVQCKSLNPTRNLKVLSVTFIHKSLCIINYIGFVIMKKKIFLCLVGSSLSIILKMCECVCVWERERERKRERECFCLYPSPTIWNYLTYFLLFYLTLLIYVILGLDKFASTTLKTNFEVSFWGWCKNRRFFKKNKLTQVATSEEEGWLWKFKFFEFVWSALPM